MGRSVPAREGDIQVVLKKELHSAGRSSGKDKSPKAPEFKEWLGGQTGWNRRNKSIREATWPVAHCKILAFAVSEMGSY